MAALASLFAWLKEWYRKAFLHPEFKKIVEVFFTEAAVLVFVFPTLEGLILHSEGTVWHRLLLGFGSLLGSVLFLSIAGILSRT
jgi:hypothetical protein